MKIAIISIIESIPWGGGEELWAEMANEALLAGDNVIISKKGWNVDIVKVQNLERKGAKVYYRRSSKVYPSIFARIKGKISGEPPVPFIRNDFEDIFTQQPDIILINEGAFGNIALFPGLHHFLIAGNIPYFILSHQNREDGLLPMSILDLSRNIYKNARKVLFVSERNREMADILLCDELQNSMVVRNPVNMSDINIVPYPHTEIPKIACVGRLDCDQKGQDLLLRALGKIKDEYPFQLTIFGKGDDEGYLRKLTAFLGIQENVSFAGHVNDIKQIWATNQMLVLPSHYEGMSLAVVEAMLSGRPCLVTDVAGNREWIDDEINGFVAEGCNVFLLEKKLRKAFEMKDKWEVMGERAHTKAMGLYDPNAGLTLLGILKENHS